MRNKTLIEDQQPVLKKRSWLVRIARMSMLLLVFSVFCSLETEATHYRYGNISWSRPSGSRIVTFTVTQAWRRSFASWAGANVGQVINTGVLNFGDGGTATLLLTVTSVNAAEDWLYGTFTVSHNYSNPASTFTASYISNARLSTLQNNANQNFRSETIVNLGVATNLASPVSSLPPIINLETNDAAASFTIPAFDADGDAFSFLPATAAEVGGGSPFVNPPGFTVSPTGVAAFSTVGRAVGQLYNAAVKITDVNGSKTIVDFLIKIVAVSNAPVFNYTIPFTPLNGTVFSINPGQPLSFNVKANDIDPLDIVTLSAVGLASGMTFTPPLPLSGLVDQPVTTQFNWTPSLGQLGVYILTFTAEDLIGAQTNTSVIINVNTNPIFIPPTPSLGSMRYVETGTSITDVIVATNPDPSVQTQLFSASIPAGSTLSNTLPTAFGITATTDLNWTPTPSNWGNHTITFVAKDANSRTTSHSYNLFANTMPAFSSVPATTAIVNQLYVYNVSATDPDVPFGDDLETILFGTVLPAWLTYTSNGDGTGTLTGTPSLGDLGDYNISFIAVDFAHHDHPDVVQSFTINVAGVPPTVTCPSDIIQNADPALCNTVVSYSATVTGIPAPVVTYSIPSGSSLPVGTHTVQVTASNGVGSDATCSFTVTVVDDQDPVIHDCPSDINLTACQESATWNAPTASDNCAGVTILQTGGPASGSTIANGTSVPVTYTATDASGRTSTCTFTVTRAPAFNSSCTVNNPQLYFGYAGDQTATFTITPGSGGVPPYKATITMNRALKCNVVVNSGDELWIPGANTNMALNVNTLCPGAGPGGVPSSTSNSFSSGSYSVNVSLMADAVITATITDANGCTTTCTKAIAAEDVRCFAGNSGNVKVAICHKTGSANNPCHEICISESALSSHLDHGDFLGNCTANCEAPVAFSGRQVIQDIAVEGLNLKAMPNPSNDYFNLGIESVNKSNVQVRVFNISGKLVYAATGAADKVYRFGEGFAPGMYMVEVKQDGLRSTIKVVRQ